MAPNQSTWKRYVGSVHVLVAASVLVVGAVVWNVALPMWQVALVKERVPLKGEGLASLPERLGPYEVVTKHRLKSDEIELLGTDEYISWLLIDTRDPEGRAAILRLHVTYYTGLRDAVPHVPDICYIAAGMTAAGAETVRWRTGDMPPAWADWQEVDVHRSRFSMRGSVDPLTVYYLFNVNGKPVSDRWGVRRELADIFKKYCYYAKIEITAYRQAPGGLVPMPPEDAARACEDFFAQAASDILDLMAPAEEIAALEASR